MACRRVSSKFKLIRLVRTTEGMKVDLFGKEPGRGAYLCPSCQCWAEGVYKGRLERALRVKLDTEAKDAIMASGTGRWGGDVSGSKEGGNSSE
ncbi:MAG: YlxR family protein [Chloroflexi bacterium]|nr:YlxR family protein [Chloroflexota bacterium]